MVVLIELVKHSVHPSCVPPNHPSDKGRLLDLDANLRGRWGMRRDCRLFWKLREGILVLQTEQDPTAKLQPSNIDVVQRERGSRSPYVENSSELRQVKCKSYHVSCVLAPCLPRECEVPSQLCLTANECTCIYLRVVLVCLWSRPIIKEGHKYKFVFQSQYTWGGWRPN